MSARSPPRQPHTRGRKTNGAGADRVAERHIGDWSVVLKRFRTLHGLTQERIADMFGVSQRTVSRWERSENKPRVECLRRLQDLELATPRPGAGSGLPEDADWPQSVAARVFMLLGQLSAENIAQLPAAERRRLADRCRQVAQLAAPRANDKE